MRKGASLNPAIAAVIAVLVILIWLLSQTSFLANMRGNIGSVEETAETVALCQRIEGILECNSEFINADSRVVDECKNVFDLDKATDVGQGCIEKCSQINYCK